MNRTAQHGILLLFGAAAFVAMWLYPPWEEVAVAGSQSIRHFAGHGWRFTGPEGTRERSASESLFQIDVVSLAWQWALLQIGFCVAAIWRSPELIVLDFEPTITVTWRSFFALRVPAVVGGSLAMAWVLPMQILLLTTLDGPNFIPVIGLTLVCVVIGSRLPEGWHRIRTWEADGRIYALFGVRQFRSFVSDGDLAVRVMRWIDPTAIPPLRRATLAKWERDTRVGEKAHMAWLLGSLPALVWAIMIHSAGFVVYVIIANVLFNIYPIMLRRYTRARLGRIQARRSFRPTPLSLSSP